MKIIQTPYPVVLGLLGIFIINYRSIFMDNLNQIKLQLKHLRDDTKALDIKLNTKPSVEVLNNYYTKTEVDDCLQVLSRSIDSINSCVITLSGQITSLQNNIDKL